ncbi:hypothetical protein ACK8HX_08290 [Oryzobacter sp. R7]|uniref:hypothetical protein n=1 Tax=Oryzobacter faecalis TaxID=3388656 RepID=UPI00398CC6A2
MRKGTVCPRCGWEKLTTVQVPRPHEAGEPPHTQRAFRCLRCDAQWVDDEGWAALHEEG